MLMTTFILENNFHDSTVRPIKSSQHSYQSFYQRCWTTNKENFPILCEEVEAAVKAWEINRSGQHISRTGNGRMMGWSVPLQPFVIRAGKLESGQKHGHNPWSSLYQGKATLESCHTISHPSMVMLNQAAVPPNKPNLGYHTEMQTRPTLADRDWYWTLWVTEDVRYQWQPDEGNAKNLYDKATSTVFVK